MTKSRPSIARPVVLNGLARRRRQPARPRDALLGAEALETPLPGQLLVLLSRLHRAEEGKPRIFERARTGERPRTADETGA